MFKAICASARTYKWCVVSPSCHYLKMKVFIVLLAVCVLVQAQNGKGKGRVIISCKNKIKQDELFKFNDSFNH